MKTQLISAALLVISGACGNKEAKSDTRTDKPIAAVNQPADAKPADAKPADAKPEEAKPEAPKPEEKPAGAVLSAFPDADLKCAVTETKVLELKVEGKVKKVDALKETFAQYREEMQSVSISSRPFDPENYFVSSEDRSGYSKDDLRLTAAFSKSKQGEPGRLSPSRGKYALTPDTSDGYIPLANFYVFTKERRIEMNVTAEIQDISTTRVCGTFEAVSQDGKTIARGEFNVPNTVK